MLWNGWHGRLFSSSRIDWQSLGAVGFDLDYSLIAYQDSLVELTVRCVLERMVARYGYNRAILEHEFDAEAAMRGLTVDRETGAVLKLDSQRIVRRARLGRRALDSAAIRAAYGETPLEVTWGRDAGRFPTIRTATGVPLLHVLADLVELQPIHGRDIQTLWEDMFKALVDVVNAHDGDDDGTKGSMRARAIAAPNAYVQEDSDRQAVLEALRDSGKRPFLVSNSEWAWVDAMARQGLGRDDWWNCFDLVIVKAQKASFFGGTRAPVKLEVPGCSHVYSGASSAMVEKSLGLGREQIMYVGDFLVEDIRPARSVGWRTLMVVPELELETATAMRHWAALWELQLERERLRSLLVGSVAGTADRLGEVEERIRLEEQGLLRAGNRHWGSFFREATGESLMGSEIMSYACSYTSRASNLLTPLRGRDNSFLGSHARPFPHEIGRESLEDSL